MRQTNNYWASPSTEVIHFCWAGIAAAPIRNNPKLRVKNQTKDRGENAVKNCGQVGNYHRTWGDSLIVHSTLIAGRTDWLQRRQKGQRRLNSKLLACKHRRESHKKTYDVTDGSLLKVDTYLWCAIGHGFGTNVIFRECGRCKQQDIREHCSAQLDAIFNNNLAKCNGTVDGHAYEYWRYAQTVDEKNLHFFRSNDIQPKSSFVPRH